MAKKKESSFVSVCAFWGLVIAAVIFVVHGIFSAFGLFTGILSILDLVGKVALLLSVALCAYSFVSGRKKGWKIVYWIALVIYIAGVVFGFIRFA